MSLFFFMEMNVKGEEEGRYVGVDEWGWKETPAVIAEKRVGDAEGRCGDEPVLVGTLLTQQDRPIYEDY
jgi:hypothetical protein